MQRAVIAGSVYFLLLFAFGFLLGTVRVLLVIPYVGTLVATMLEVPVMLAAAYVVCPRVIRRFKVPPERPARGVMALVFLILLALFESALGSLLFNRTMADQWAALSTPAGMLGLSAQIIAALFPLRITTP